MVCGHCAPAQHYHPSTTVCLSYVCRALLRRCGAVRIYNTPRAWHHGAALTTARCLAAGDAWTTVVGCQCVAVRVWVECPAVAPSLAALWEYGRRTNQQQAAAARRGEGVLWRGGGWKP